MRLRECPPSRPSERTFCPCASSSRLKDAPRLIRSWMRSGPSWTSTATASSLHSPAPAISVSCLCSSKELSSASTPAIPPAPNCCSRRSASSSSAALLNRAALPAGHTSAPPARSQSPENQPRYWPMLFTFVVVRARLGSAGGSRCARPVPPRRSDRRCPPRATVKNHPAPRSWR